MRDTETGSRSVRQPSGGEAYSLFTRTRSGKELAEKRREPCFVEAMLGDGDHGGVEFCSGSASWHAIQLQKIKRRSDSRALIAIEKSLRLRDVESVCGGDTEQFRAA